MPLLICDLILSAIMLALGVFVINTVSGWPDYSRLSVLGPDIFPRYLGWFFIAAGIILLAGVLYRLLLRKKNADGVTYIEAEREGVRGAAMFVKTRWRDILTFVCLPLLMFLFAKLLKPVGFEICAVVFLFIALLLCGERRWYCLTFIPIGTTAVIYVVFCLLLKVSIPLHFL